jgi:hypothetical protein
VSRLGGAAFELAQRTDRHVCPLGQLFLAQSCSAAEVAQLLSECGCTLPRHESPLFPPAYGGPEGAPALTALACASNRVGW